MKKITEKLEKKLGISGLVDKLIDNLSGSELNTLLLELFKTRTKQISPPRLLTEYNQNRFCSPASVDPISYKEDEIFWLKSASQYGFKPVLLSPLAPLGSCSVVGCVNQNKVVSALRGSEVVSDATNVLAIKVANEISNDRKVEVKKYCTTHRHTRGQYYNNPEFSAHFGAFCMVSGGVNRSGNSFEMVLAKEHILFYLNMLLSLFKEEDLSLEIYVTDNANQISSQIKDEILLMCQELALELKLTDFKFRETTNQYYQIIQFKIFLNYQSNRIDVADGGFVDWTQKILTNQKQRLFISGVGLEIIHKICQGVL